MPDDPLKIYYVGCTSQELSEYIRSKRFKFKQPDIKIRPLVSNIATEEEALSLETDYIKRYDTFRNGWNKCPIGTGQFQKGHKMHLGNKQSQEQIDKMVATRMKNGSYVRSEECKQKTSIKMKERWKDPEYVKNVMEGRKKAREKKLSESI